jgi:hypothetical protein
VSDRKAAGTVTNPQIAPVVEQFVGMFAQPTIGFAATTNHGVLHPKFVATISRREEPLQAFHEQRRQDVRVRVRVDIVHFDVVVVVVVVDMAC